MPEPSSGYRLAGSQGEAAPERQRPGDVRVQCLGTRVVFLGHQPRARAASTPTRACAGALIVAWAEAVVLLQGTHPVLNWRTVWCSAPCGLVRSAMV